MFRSLKVYKSFTWISKSIIGNESRNSILHKMYRLEEKELPRNLFPQDKYELM